MGQSPENEFVNTNNRYMEFHQGKIFFSEKYLNYSGKFTKKITKIAEKKSVLLCVRAPVGIINITERDICIGRGLCAIKPNTEISSEFLFYWLKIYKKFFEHSATGTTFKAITINTVNNLLIPLPPIFEQKKILYVIENYIRLINLLKIDYDTIHNYVNTLKYKILDSVFGENSSYKSYYENKKIKELCDIISGTSYCKNDICNNNQNNSIRILRGGNIQNHKLLINNNDVFISDSLSDPAKNIKIGDTILVASTGSQEAIGKATYISKDYINTQIGAFLRIIRPKNFETAEYISLVFMSKWFKKYIKEKVKGTNINNIKDEYLENLSIPFPSLSKQREIVDFVKKIFHKLDLIYDV